jgi:hypothetical protein
MNETDFVIQQKIKARQKKAKLSNLLSSINLTGRGKIIQAILNEQKIIKFQASSDNLEEFKKLIAEVRAVELPIELPGAPAENQEVKPEPKINFGQFLDAIEKDLQLDNHKFGTLQNIKQDELNRWARKLAFQQYYRNMNLAPETPITKVYGDDKTVRQIAPNKDTIYNLYLDKLEELRRRSDKFKFSDDKFNEVLSDGTPQGGAFEKWLERHREDIMNSIYSNR